MWDDLRADVESSFLTNLHLQHTLVPACCGVNTFTLRAGGVLRCRKSTFDNHADTNLGLEVVVLLTAGLLATTSRAVKPAGGQHFYGVHRPHSNERTPCPYCWGHWGP